jgi:hypothetical protein
VQARALGSGPQSYAELFHRWDANKNWLLEEGEFGELDMLMGKVERHSDISYEEFSAVVRIRRSELRKKVELQRQEELDEEHGDDRARLHCLFVLPLIQFMPYS